MKNFLPALLVLSLAGQAFAGTISNSTAVRDSAYGPYGGRDDGLYFEQTAETPIIVSNGAKAGVVGAAFYENFEYGDGDGMFTLQLDGTIFDGTALVINVAEFKSGVKLAYWANVTETLDIDMDDVGLDIGADQTNNDGMSVQSGRYGTSGRAMYPGEDPAFKFCVGVQSTDADGSDRFFAGLVEVDANQSVPAAAIGTYTDFAGIGWNTAADPIALKSQTSDADTETVSALSITLAESTTAVLCTHVSSTGAVTYSVDGVTATAAPSYTLATGTAVLPTVFYLHDTAVSDALYLTSWEVSFE